MAEPAIPPPELILSHLDRLPTLPAVALRLLEIVTLDDGSVAEIVRHLRADQSLTATVLSAVNCAAAGVRQPVATLERAVPLLGLTAVRNIVLATSVFGCFAPRDPTKERGAFDLLEFWKHALAVGCAARRFSQARPDLKLDPEGAFVAGLLHDLGKVALGALFPKAYERIAAQANESRGDIADSERAVLGADHTVAGRRLAERWRLPRELQETIWLHHLAADALPSSVRQPRLLGIVRLADTLAREQRIGYSGNHAFLETAPQLAGRLGITPAHLRGVIDALASDVAQQASLLGLDGETPQGLYVKAMTRANAELGRLNADLLTGHRRLAAAARYFAAITHFESALRDWTDPAAVVAALADAASEALQRPRLVAFGVRESGAALDVRWLGLAAGVPDRATQALPADLSDWLAGQGTSGDVVGVQDVPGVQSLLAPLRESEQLGTPWVLLVRHEHAVTAGVAYLSESDERARLAGEAAELHSFLASVGLAMGRANAQAAGQRLSEDLAETNRRLQQVQVELLRSRALSMIAEMAAGAGHELNGPLTVISGRAQLLAAQLKDPEARRVLQTISDKAHECSGIVTELMDFARPRAARLAALDLRALLAEVRDEALRRSGLAPSRLRLEIAPEDAPVMVDGDREQLACVFRELLNNALDAIASGDGSIVLRCRHTMDADTLQVLVEDAGCGMTPTVLQRAFDPFFSHRTAGRGRGLGLPRAYRIVEAHGGRIWLESRPGEGTTAHVVLRRPAASTG